MSTRNIQEQPELIGRGPELQQLTVALDRAARGSGRAVLVSGAVGMGKSRLVQELMGIAASRGYLVLASRAYPLDDNLVYAPVISSLGPYLRQLPAPEQAGLVEGLPYVVRLIQGLPASEPVQALEKIQLLENVARLVERIAQGRPLLWFVDDLHCADQATVELFYYLARNVSNQRVLLLGAYRSNEPDALRHLHLPLLALARHGLSDEVRLQRLGPADVALLASHRLAARPTRTLLEHLEARALGVPLICLALLTSLEEQGLLTRVGGAVRLNPAASRRPALAAREIMLERLAGLERHPREVLDVLAVLGGAAQQGELERAVGTRGAVLLEALGRLQAAGLITEQGEEPDGALSVSVSHPLLQEVVYAELPSLVRRRYHAQAAAALESLRPGSVEGMSPLHLERLARQYEGAGGEPDPQRALQVLLAAAERAAMAAGPEAPHYYRAALALVRGGLQPALLPTLLLRLGQSLGTCGEMPAARACLLEALQIAIESGDALAAGRMHMHLAYVEFALADLDAVTANVGAGIEKLSGYGWSTELVNLYGLRCTADLMRSNIASVPGHAATLAEGVAALQTPVARAWHAHAQVWAGLLAGRVNDSVARADECLEQAWLAQDPLLVILAALDRANTLLLRGDHRPAAAALRATLARLPGPYLLSAQHALSPMLILAESMAGNWEAALEVSDESAPLEPLFQVLPRGNLGARALVLVRRGDLVQARECLTEASQYRRPFVTEWEYAEALLALENGEYAHAVEVAGKLHTWSMSPLGLAVQAEAQAALGEVDGARNIALFLTASGGSLDLPLLAALGAWAMGLAERAAGDTAAAGATLARAATQFERLAMPFEAARARFEQAQLLAATDRRGASAMARQSLQVFSKLGAGAWAGRVRRWRAGQTARTAALEHKSKAPFSPRELEIVRLLDEGLISAEIAVRLMLSPRTVANHLARMYTRYGVKNRLSLVRLAREDGLL